MTFHHRGLQNQIMRRNNSRQFSCNSNTIAVIPMILMIVDITSKISDKKKLQPTLIMCYCRRKNYSVKELVENIRHARSQIRTTIQKLQNHS